MNNANDNLDFLKGATGLGSQLSMQYNWNSYGSDHVPFQQAGYAGILHIERDDTNYPGYHRPTDQVNYANWNQLRDIARIVVGQVCDYAVLLPRNNVNVTV